MCFKSKPQKCESSFGVERIVGLAGCKSICDYSKWCQAEQLRKEFYKIMTSTLVCVDTKNKTDDRSGTGGGAET